MSDDVASLSDSSRESNELGGVIVRGIRAHFSFAALLAILFLTFLDNTVASAVLTSVQAKLHANVSQLQWVVGGYALAFASLMLMFGALGDNFGRKRLMLTGVAIFCGGSIICAISVNPSELVIGRIIMGIGAAASEPATLSMIRHIYPDHKARARALGAWAATTGLALAMGPILGGILVGIWSWRAVFWFNLVFGALAFVVAAIALPESVNDIRKKVDFPGFFFGAVVLGTATFACIQGELSGYESGWVMTLFIVSFLTVPVFYLAEKHAKDPMLEMGFFRRKSFSGSAFIAFASYFSIFSIFFFVALYLEVVVSVSAYGLALDFLPLLGGIVVASLFTGRWVGRIGSRIPMTVGCLLAGSGVLFTYWAIGPNVSLVTLGWTMGLAGVGFGIVIVPVNRLSRLTGHALTEALSMGQEVKAVTVVLQGGDEGTRYIDTLRQEWRKWDPGVPLHVVHNEYASVVQPIVEFIDDVRRDHPHDQIVVLIPVVRPDHVRQRILHNQIDLVLSRALRSRTDIVVARVTTPLEPPVKAPVDPPA